MNWDDDKTDTLVALWRDKQTSTAIAKELGITRNAVMGKLGRLGLIGKGPPKRPPPGRKFKMSITGIEAPAPKEIRKLHDNVSCETPPKGAEQPGPLNCKLVDLTENSCRWPIGDPQDWENFSFCGAPRDGHKPYCTVHWRTSWAKTAPPFQKYFYAGQKIAT